MKNTKTTDKIKTRIIASILTVITIISVISAATVSASAAFAEEVIDKAAYNVSLTAIGEYVPGGKLIAPALEAIFGSFMDNGPSLGDISKDISDMRSEMNTQFNEVKNQMKNYTEAIENKIVDQTVISDKGAGSAIFLHCLGPNKPFTGGCVAIPENQMKIVMQNVKPDCKVVIDSLDHLGGSF